MVVAFLILLFAVSNAQELTNFKDEFGWIQFPEDGQPEAATFFEDYAVGLNLTDEDEMVQKSNRYDEELDISVVRYRQLHGGIEVENCYYILHVREGRVVTAYGKLSGDTPNETGTATYNQTFILTGEEAVDAAKSAINASLYAWESGEWEDDLKSATENPDATYYPAPTPKLLDVDGEHNYIPVYEINILAVEPYGYRQVIVDGRNGDIIGVFDLGEACFEGGGHPAESLCVEHLGGLGTDKTDGLSQTQLNCHTGIVLIPGMPSVSQDISTFKRGGIYQDFILKDECRAAPGSNTWAIHTRSENKFAQNGGSFSDANNNWGSNERAQAHWAVQKSWDYFKDKFAWNGTDGNFKKLEVFPALQNVQSGSNTSPAVFFTNNTTPDQLQVISGQQSLEIMGHEYTHGVANRHFSSSTTAPDPLENTAVKEGYSDIFSQLIELHTKGSADWKVTGTISGTSVTNASFFIRDFADPSLSVPAQPSDRFGTNWSTTLGHTDCGVVNHWFYTLTFGGTGIQGLGIAKTEKITYKSLYIIVDNPTLADMRAATIQAAIMLHGPCSNEVVQTTNAWAKRNVGDPYNQPPCVVFGPSKKNVVYCNDNSITVKAYTNLQGTLSYAWTATGSTAIISGQGTQNATFANLAIPSTTVSVTVSNGTTNASAPQTFTTKSCRFAAPNQTGIQLYQIHPNPAEQYIDVVMPAAHGNAEVRVYDMLGRLLIAQAVSKSENRISVSVLPQGCYKLLITSGQDTYTTTLVK